MTDLEKALQAGAEDITDYDRAVKSGGVDPSAAPQRRGYPEPKSLRASDAELGIESGPMVTDLSRPGMGVRREYAPRPLSGGQGERETFPPLPPKQTEMEGDPLAQMVATAAVLGPIGRAVVPALRPLLGPLAVPSVAAGEGALASKSMGGSAGTGALLGGGLGVLGALSRAASPAAAAARVEGRLARDVNRGSTSGTSASKPLADAVKARAGEGNANLAQVSNELPGVGRALKTQARTNPHEAASESIKALDDLTGQNDVVYDAIQAAHGGAPVTSMTNKLADLWTRLTKEGRGVPADAVERFHNDIINRYGANSKLTAEQLRNIRNDIGDIAFPTKDVNPGTITAAKQQIHDVFNEAIEEVAKQTPGVDVAALTARNRQISTLIPVRKALDERVGKLADSDMGVFDRAKAAPGRALTRAAREIDYRLSLMPQFQVGRGNTGGTAAAPAAMSAQQQQERDLMRTMLMLKDPTAEAR